MTQNFDVNIERSVLNSLVFEPEILQSVKSFLYPQDFYIPQHQSIYSAMLTLDEKTMPIDESFIKKVLGNSFDESTMIDLLLANPIANITSYVSELKEKRQRRDLIHLGVGIARSVDEAENVSSVLNDLSKSIESIENVSTISAYTYKCIVDADDKDTELILQNWLPLPRGTVSMFAAQGGTGKTWAAIQAALRHAKSFPGKQVALWLSEDPEGQSKSRARAVSEEILNTTFSDFRNVQIFQDVPTPLVQDKKLDMYEFRKLKKSLVGFDFIIFDPLTSFYGGEENDNSQAVKFMLPFKKWALEENISILFLHHSRKDGGVRGASAFVDACRCVYEMDKIYVDLRKTTLDMEKPHMRNFNLTKDNYGVIRLLANHNVEVDVTPKRSAPALVIEYTDTKVEMPAL